MTQILWIGLFILNIWFVTTKSKQFDEDEDSRIFEFETPKRIQLSDGRDVKLRCGIRANHAEYNLSSMDVQWNFKPCGEGFNRTSCTDDENINKISWVTVNCDGKPCNKSTLTLKNLTENDSGLYNCSIFPYKPSQNTTLMIRVVRTYQLEIINSTILPPKIVGENPTTITTSTNNHIVLQCKVYSKSPAWIKWFRQIGNTNQTNHNYYDSDPENIHLKETMKNHKAIESAGEKKLSEDTYLSKLIINNVSENDTGLYICVGINLRGFKVLQIHLNVISDNIINQSEIKNLLLLFLIPAVFLLLPLMAWGCYIYRTVRTKRKKKPEIEITYELKRIVYRK